MCDNLRWSGRLPPLQNTDVSQDGESYPIFSKRDGDSLGVLIQPFRTIVSVGTPIGDGTPITSGTEGGVRVIPIVRAIGKEEFLSRAEGDLGAGHGPVRLRETRDRVHRSETEVLVWETVRVCGTAAIYQCQRTKEKVLNVRFPLNNGVR